MSLGFLYDRNKNGHWDPGNFFEGKIFSRIVKPINQKITIRSNWDNEFDIDFVKAQDSGVQGSMRLTERCAFRLVPCTLCLAVS